VVLTSLREKLIKIGAKVVSHGRYVTFQMAEVAVPRQMFQEILSLIARLRAAPAPARPGDGAGCDSRRRQRCALMKAKQRVPALRGGQPDDLASNRGSCDRISLRRASMRRKIALNNPGIWEMSIKLVWHVDARGFVLNSPINMLREIDWG